MFVGFVQNVRQKWQLSNGATRFTTFTSKNSDFVGVSDFKPSRREQRDPLRFCHLVCLNPMRQQRSPGGAADRSGGHCHVG